MSTTKVTTIAVPSTTAQRTKVASPVISTTATAKNKVVNTISNTTAAKPAVVTTTTNETAASNTNKTPGAKTTQPPQVAPRPKTVVARVEVANATNGHGSYL